MRDKAKDFRIIINREENNGDLPSIIVEQMIALISKEILVPGDKLPSELEMTRRFGISRITLRESMKLLEAKGYIASQGRKGKFICAVTDAHISRPLMDMVKSDSRAIVDILEVKRSLMRETAFLAAERASDGDIKELNTIIRDLRKSSAGRSAASAEKSVEHYFRFFTIFAGALNNTVFAHLNFTLSSVLHHALIKEGAALASKKELCEPLIVQLENITKALAERSSENTKKAVSAHIDRMKAELIQG